MRRYFFVLVVIGFLFRLFLVNLAHHGDLNNNISWGQELWNRGIVDYYGSDDADHWPYSAPNQPPLYVLTYASAVYFYDLIDSGSRYLNENIRMFPSSFIWFWEESGMRFLVKLPSIVADVFVSVAIYYYIATKKKDEKSALIISGVWLFNPISWYNSAVWGQTDSIVNLFGLIAILALLSKNLVKSSFWYSIAFVFKGSLMIFAPVFGVVALMQKHKSKSWLGAIGVSFLIIVLTSIWFQPSINYPLWLVDLYKNRILPGEIGYLSANAFNLWWLVDSGKTLDSTLYLGISARMWGLLAVFSVYIFVLIKTYKGKLNDKNLFLSLALLALATFLLMTRMHERYLYPFFPIATLGIFHLRWLIVPYIILSITYLLNMYHLFFVPSIPVLEAAYEGGLFPSSLAIINLLVFLYFIPKYHREMEAS